MARSTVRCSVAVIALALLAKGPARAQGGGGASLERAYGVVGNDTDERRRMNEELRRVVARMSDAIGFKPKSVRILGGNDPRRDREVNALALPNGQVYVMAGLISAARRTTDPEASLAFVVGHEMTHVVRHHSRSQMKTDILGALGGALLAKMLGAGSSGIRTGSDLGSGLLGGHYSREHEYEADRGGLVGMSRAGYPVDSAAEMMQVLLDRYGVDRSPEAAWFGSHPNTRNRVLRLKAMAAEIKAGGAPAPAATPAATPVAAPSSE